MTIHKNIEFSEFSFSESTKKLKRITLWNAFNKLHEGRRKKSQTWKYEYIGKWKWFFFSDKLLFKLKNRQTRTKKVTLISRIQLIGERISLKKFKVHCDTPDRCNGQFSDSQNKNSLENTINSKNKIPLIFHSTTINTYRLINELLCNYSENSSAIKENQVRNFEFLWHRVHSSQW